MVPIATELGAAYISVTTETSKVAGELKKAFSGAESSGADAGKSAGRGFGLGFAGIATAAVGALGVGTFLKGAIEGAGSLQQSAGAISSVFKGSAADMLAWSQTADTAVGLTQNEFNELGTLIGSQLKNGGTAMDELAPKTNSLIGVGADLASMFGGTTADAVGALSSALKGERDPIEKYGVSLNQAKIDAEAAALGFTKVGGSLSAEANQAATLSLIMKQTADAHGNFAKEADTMAGAQQRMSAGFKDIQTNVGGLFLPIMTQAFGFVNTNILPSLDKFTASLGDEGLGGAFAPLMAVAGPIFSSLAASFGPLIPQVIQLASSFSPLGLLFQVLTPILPMLATAFTQISGSIAGVLAIVIPLVTQLVSALLPVIVNLVSTVLPPLAAVFGELVAAVGPFVTQLASALIPIIQALMPVVTTVFGIIASVISSVMQIVMGVIQVVTGIISGNWAQVWEGIQKVFGGIWDTIVALVGGAIGFVWSVIQNGLNVVFGFIGDVLGNIGRVFSDTWDNVSKGVSDFIGGVGKFFEELPDKIMETLKGANMWLYDAGTDIVNGLFDGIKSLAGTIGNFFLGLLPGWIVEPFKIALGIHSPSRVFKGFGQNIGQGLLDGVDAMQGKIDGTMSNLVTVPAVPSFGASAYTPATFGAAGGAGMNAQFTINQVDDPIGTSHAVVRRLQSLSA